MATEEERAAFREELLKKYNEPFTPFAGKAPSTRGVKGEQRDQGPPGEDGVDGEDGIDGKDGKDGKDGIAGKDGTEGKDGKDGTDGKDGIDGKDGKDGTDGEDGKDAPVEEINQLQHQGEQNTEEIKKTNKRVDKVEKRVDAVEDNQSQLWVGAGGGGGGTVPTGTGFTHITGGAQDAAAKVVDLASADVTGVLPDANIDSAIARDAEVTAEIATHAGAADPHTGYQKESEKDAASGYAGLTAGTKLNLAQMQEVIAHADLTDSPADAHHAQAHGAAAHTEHATWKALYTDGSGDEQELALGAAPSATLGHTYYRSEGASSAPVMAQEMKTVTITVENPTATEDILVTFFFQAVTIREVQAGVVGTGTPSVTINPVHGTDRSAAGTALLNAATAITNTTTGQNLASWTDNTLAADEMLRLKTTAKSGTTVTELWVTFRYTVD